MGDSATGGKVLSNCTKISYRNSYRKNSYKNLGQNSYRNFSYRNSYRKNSYRNFFYRNSYKNLIGKIPIRILKSSAKLL